MTDAEYVHYIFIVDRSGSMNTIRKDTEEGIKAFIDKQLEGVDSSKRTVSFYQFDTEHECLHNFDLLEKAKDYKLEPRGSTALLDACGQAITNVGHSLKHMPEDQRPGYVMVIICTDGEENSSREYKKAEIKKMIQHQQDKYNWRFTYIGANQDAFTEARSLGISGQSVLNYTATSRSVGTAWATASAGTSAGTAPTSTGIFYTQDQQEAVMKP
jgi:uncharacterized protein YegL